MPYFRLDDGFHSHPKVLNAGNAAAGLYARCGSYAAQHLTDGFIPEHIAVLYGAAETHSRGYAVTNETETLAETLVNTKLWRRVRGGYRMPDYLDYNYSKEQIETQRLAAAERQQRKRERDENPRSKGPPSRRESRRDTSVSHAPPSQAFKNPPNPPPSGGTPCSRHKRWRRGCAACAPTPQPPSIYALCDHGKDGATCPFCRSEAI